MILKMGKRAGPNLCNEKYRSGKSSSYNVTYQNFFPPNVTVLKKEGCSEPVVSFIIREDQALLIGLGSST